MGMRSIAVKLSLIFGVALAATMLAITLYATLNVRRQAVDNFNEAGFGQIRQIVAPGANDPQNTATDRRRYLVIAPAVDGVAKAAVQVQSM